MLYDDGVMVDMEARNIHGLYFPSSSFFPEGMRVLGPGSFHRILELHECIKVSLCIETYSSFLKASNHLSYVRSEHSRVICIRQANMPKGKPYKSQAMTTKSPVAHVKKVN